MFEEVLPEALHYAEQLYDRVVRRWGNVKFAQSCVYDWIWSDEFRHLSHCMDERERGHLRLAIMKQFHVKPWPWFSSPDPSLER